MDYTDSLRFIFSFTNFEVTPASAYTSKTFDLTRMERLLAGLRNPHLGLEAVHVAGTKGKGSTAAMIESVLRAAGYVTGFYTSPHLHTFRERIRVNGKMIAKGDVAAGVEKIMPLTKEMPDVTSFEIMTALAFDYFAAKQVEIGVLEVGLGGRLDATNVITPRVSVITSISYDHTAVLGKTLGEIAREKAGIIKTRVPVVCAPQRDEALDVIRATARERSAPLVTVSSQLECMVAGSRFRLAPRSQTLDAQSFDWEAGAKTKIRLTLPLVGRHQLENAATALAAIEVLRNQGAHVSDRAIREGIASVNWPGRFELLARSPYIIVDGAHNGDSARQLVATANRLFPEAPITFIFGTLADKDARGMLEELLGRSSSLIITRPRHPRAADPAKLVGLARERGIEPQVTDSINRALGQALREATRETVIVVTGSVAFSGEAREILLREQGKPPEKD